MNMVLHPERIDFLGYDIADWEEFEGFANLIVKQLQLTHFHLYAGADRGQMVFDHQQLRYVLYFEAVCEALWVESDSKFSESLHSLYKILSME